MFRYSLLCLTLALAPGAAPARDGVELPVCEVQDGPSVAPETACKLESTDFDEAFRLVYLPGDGAGAEWRLFRPGHDGYRSFDGYQYASVVQDIHGDGWMLLGWGNVNAAYDVHRFDPASRDFVKIGTLSNLAYRNVDGLIASGGRSSAAAWEYQFYALEGNALVPVFDLYVERTEPDDVDCEARDAPGRLRPHPVYGQAPLEALASEDLLAAYCGHYHGAMANELAARDAYEDTDAFWVGLEYCADRGRKAVDCMSSYTGFAACAAETPISSSLVRCVREDLAFWDGKINDIYRSLRSHRSSGFRNDIQTAQRAWMALRDADCALIDGLDTGQKAAELLQMSCLRQHTAARVADLWALHRIASPVTRP